MEYGIGHFTVVHALDPFLGHGSTDVKAHMIRFRSGTLSINGWLYEPLINQPEISSDHPIDQPVPPGAALIIGHGGIWGIPIHYDYILRRLAIAGWTVVVPGYRGEYSSDGKIEFALGEVDDTLACREALLSVPGIDPKKIWLLGSSHGAMVSVLAMARTDDSGMFAGAVAVSGVYDVESWIKWLREVDHDLLREPDMKRLFRARSDDYKKRSAIYQADKIRAPLFLIHGDSDTMVPMEQTERFAEAVRLSGHGNCRLLIEPGADHEFIWGPDRDVAVDAWSGIMDFIGNPDRV